MTPLSGWLSVTMSDPNSESVTHTEHRDAVRGDRT